MISRFSYLIVLLFLFFLNSCEKDVKDSKNDTLVRYVDPMIGTAGHGHTFPGATQPFGMVQLSPDTYNEGWDWCSGYHYSDNSIMGFSHTHLSGTGRGDLLDILMMPTRGEINFNPGTRENPDKGYRSRFSHQSEIARPGYYSVMLDDYQIGAELTTTTRAGFHKYRFPEIGEGNLVIDLGHKLATDTVLQGSLEIVNDTLVVGSRQSKGWGEEGEEYFVEHEVFFAARFSHPIKSSKFQVNGQIVEDGSNINGDVVKCNLVFDTNPSEPLMIKVGISQVDIDGALGNVDHEIPGWNFEKKRKEASLKWNEVLETFQVKDDNEANKETFYTAVYHSCIAPFTSNDVDGRYMGFDDSIHTADNFTMLTGLSLWDTFRAANPLYTIMMPSRVNDIVNSMLAQYDQYGLLPVWPLCSSETNCMIGYHSVPVIVDAYFKGFRGYDVEKAYKAVKASAMQDDFDIDLYKKYNYIPRDSAQALSVARTLEYAFDDYCIAQMARDLGYEEDYRYFSKRSQAYKNVFDESIGFMRGKDSEGIFKEDFDPYNANNATSDFIEGNSWQFTWFVPHDIPFLVEGMGGQDNFVERLDSLFSVSSDLEEGTPVDVSGLIGQYAHGNEPSHHVAYLFNYANAPWKTQERVHEIMNTLYSNQPGGLCGNEDMGQMSAWYVFSAMGFYPVNPADGRYVFGKPLFEEVSLNLPGGEIFRIKAHNLSDKNIYIQKVMLNDQEYDKGYITHQDIAQGGTLEFFMQDHPGMEFSMD